MMETDENGHKKQFFPITHISAVLGLREFMEGNFFQANFDQVMAQLQAHYNRVSQEIDKKASEIEQHANQKIEEFDTKISESDEKMTNLESEIKDIQELVESNDIPTRDEVSANVIYQLIGKENFEMTFTMDFKEKVRGSVNENPNTLFGLGTTTLPQPAEMTTEVVQERYTAISEIDGNTVNSSITDNAYFPKFGAKWNLVEHVKKVLGEEYFFTLGATTLAQQVDLLRAKITRLSGNLYAYGHSPNGYKVSMGSWLRTTNAWEPIASHTSDTISKLTIDIDKPMISNYIDDNGFFYTLVYSDPSDGKTATRVVMDYTNVVFTMGISANEHIKSMIAAYSGKNSVSLSEPQTVEGLKNFSDGVQSKGIDVATQDITKVTLFQSTEISNVKGTAAGIVWPIDEAAIVFGGVGAHARRGGTSEPGTIYFNEAGQYLIELLWFVNSGTATRKYVYMDWIKHGTTDLLFRSGIGKINGFSYTSSVQGGGIVTMEKDEGIDILLKTNVEDLIAGVKIYYIKITKIG